MRSLNTRRDMSKTILNSPILINNDELDNIEVNKGRIYGELRYFVGVLQILIKSNDELR